MLALSLCLAVAHHLGLVYLARGLVVDGRGVVGAGHTGGSFGRVEDDQLVGLGLLGARAQCEFVRGDFGELLVRRLVGIVVGRKLRRLLAVEERLVRVVGRHHRLQLLGQVRASVLEEFVDAALVPGVHVFRGVRRLDVVRAGVAVRVLHRRHRRLSEVVLGELALVGQVRAHDLLHQLHEHRVVDAHLLHRGANLREHCLLVLEVRGPVLVLLPVGLGDLVVHNLVGRQVSRERVLDVLEVLVLRGEGVVEEVLVRVVGRLRRVLGLERRGDHTRLRVHLVRLLRGLHRVRRDEPFLLVRGGRVEGLLAGLVRGGLLHVVGVHLARLRLDGGDELVDELGDGDLSRLHLGAELHERHVLDGVARRSFVVHAHVGVARAVRGRVLADGTRVERRGVRDRVVGALVDVLAHARGLRGVARVEVSVALVVVVVDPFLVRRGVRGRARGGGGHVEAL